MRRLKPVIMSFCALHSVLSPYRLPADADWPSIQDLSGATNLMTVFETIVAGVRCLYELRASPVMRCLVCKCCFELGLCLASSAHAIRVR